MTTAEKAPKAKKADVKAPKAKRVADVMAASFEGLPKNLATELRIFWQIEDHTGLYRFDRNIKTPEDAGDGMVAAMAPAGLAQFSRVKDVEKVIAKLAEIAGK